MRMSHVTEPVNLGNPQEMTILQLTGRRSQIIYKPLPMDDPGYGSRISPAPKHCRGGSHGCRSQKG